MSTNHQLKCFLLFLFFGIIFNLIYSIFSIIILRNSQKKIKNNIFNGIFSLIFIVFFEILKNLFNYGLFNIVILFSYLFGFFTMKKASNKSVVFFQKKWYNLLQVIKNIFSSQQKKCQDCKLNQKDIILNNDSKQKHS